MKICPSCGKNLEDSAKFCDNCGLSIAPAAPRFCSNCGQKLAADAVFCTNCGSAVRETLEPSEMEAPLAPPAVGDDPAAGQLATVQPPAPPSVPPLSVAPQAGTFCTNCGEKVPAGSTFCPNCNTIIQTQPSGPRVNLSFKKPDRRLLAVAAAAVVLIVAVVLLPKLFSSPTKTFISAQEEVFLTPLLSAMEAEMDTYGSGKFSTDMTISASVDSYEIDRYLMDSSVVLKLDANQSDLLANGELTFMGSQVLSGTVTYQKGELGFYLPEIDDSYYVMDLSELLESMYIDGVDLSDVKLPEFSGKEWRALVKAYLDVVYTAVNKQNLKVEKGVTFRLSELGGSYTGTVYTYTPRAEDIEAMLEKLADHLEKDKDLRSLILKLVNSKSLQETIGSSYGYDGLDSALDEVLQKLAEELRDRAKYIGRSVENSGFSWKLYMEGEELRMVRVEARGYDRVFVFEREGTEAKGCTQLFYDASYGGNTVYFRNEYIKTGDVYDGEVYISNGYGNSVNVRYDMDTSKRSVLGIPYGSYDLSVPYENIQCSMEVQAGKSGSTDHVVTLRGSSYMFGGAFSRLELTVNTTQKSSAKKPSKKATDISDYSEWELRELMYGLMNQAESELDSLYYGFW